jgi:hypothetical protein
MMISGRVWHKVVKKCIISIGHQVWTYKWIYRAQDQTWGVGVGVEGHELMQKLNEINHRGKCSHFQLFNTENADAPSLILTII